MAVAPEVANATKEVVRFIGYALPLVLIPWLFRASSSMLGRLHGSTDKLFRGLGKKVEEPLKLRRDEAIMRMAGSKNPYIRKAAPTGHLTRQQEQESRKRQLGIAQSQFLSQHAQENAAFARRSAGVSGAAGVTAVQAQAVSVAQKAEDEKLSNSQILLMSQLRGVGVDQKNLASQLKKYLDDPSDAKNAILEGQLGKLDLRTLDKDRMKAALHVSASIGEVMTIEAARKSSGAQNGYSEPGEFQSMVDDVIYRNDGTLKGKGGYHLATNFGLAYGRAPQIAAANKARDAARVAYTAAEDQFKAADRDYSSANAEYRAASASGDTVTANAAYGRMQDAANYMNTSKTNMDNLSKEIQAQLKNASNVFAQARLDGIADSSARDFSSMKSGVVAAVAESIQAGLIPRDKDGNSVADKLAATLKDVVENQNLRADISQNYDQVYSAIEKLRPGAMVDSKAPLPSDQQTVPTPVLTPPSSAPTP